MNRVIASLAALALVLAACSSSGGATTPDPAVVFCPALDNYGKTLVALEALTSSSSVAEWQAAVANAKTAQAAVVAVAGPFAGAQIAEAQVAQTNLEAAARALPSGATPAEAESTLQPLLETLIGEVAGTRNATCNDRPTPSPS